MRRWILVAQTLLLLPASALCQTTSTDSQTLEALLTEVRQLRQELRTTTNAAQRAQILIYRMQAQQTVVARLLQRVDDDRAGLARNQSEQKRFIAAIKRLEDVREAQTDTERKQTDEQLAQMKARLEQLSIEEEESQPRKIELEEQLRAEQTRLVQLQDELDRVDKALDPAGRGLANSPQ